MAKKACCRYWPAVTFVALLSLALNSMQASLGGESRVVSAEAIKKGKLAFVRASCWGCHAHGDNTLNQDKPLKGPGFAKRYPDDQKIRDFVRKGSIRRGMPAFSKDRLSESDLDNIVIFIRSLTPAK